MMIAITGMSLSPQKWADITWGFPPDRMWSQIKERMPRKPSMIPSAKSELHMMIAITGMSRVGDTVAEMELSKEGKRGFQRFHKINSSQSFMGTVPVDIKGRTFFLKRIPDAYL